jgi:hypothetical protein
MMNNPHDREKAPVDKKVQEEIRRLRELADHLRRRAFEAFRKKKRKREPPDQRLAMRGHLRIGGAMNAQAGSNSQGTMGMQGRMQGGGGRRGMRGDAGERRMTDCLNNAAAQHQSMDGCRR